MTMKKLLSTRNQVLEPFVGPSKRGKLQPTYSWLRMETFQPNFDHQIFLVKSTLAASLQFYAK